MVNPLSIPQSVLRLSRIMLMLTLIFGIAFAQADIQQAMTDLCNNARALLGLGAMVLVILAAAIYAIGQVVGAETRARASVWATAMLTGAVIGIIIYLLVPPLINTLLAGSTYTEGDPCAFSFGS